MTKMQKLATSLLFGTMLMGTAPAFAEAVLHRGNAGEPQTLDYAHISIDIEGFVVRDLFEGLTIYDANGKIVPGTAESWTVSDDETVYTFKIRDNANWSDGSPVTAEDFVFAMRRLEDPKTAAEYANILYPIKNAEKANKGEVPIDQLGIKAIDAKTVEITLERPTPFFLQLLAHYTALPLSKANFEKFGDQFVKPGNMVSNGAFVLQAHVPNDTLTVVKNEKYWDAANVKLDKVIFYPIDDDAASVRRFEAKELDLVYNFSADQIKRLRESYSDQVHVTRVWPPTTMSSTTASRRITTSTFAARCRWQSTATSSPRKSTPAPSFRPTTSCRRALKATAKVRSQISQRCRRSTAKTRPSN